ncbi:MAG: FAD-dependent monooxygenase [Pirellulales bacterium]
MTNCSFRTVVLGAGPAGAATALLLARRGVSVAILEQASLAERERMPSELFRVETLPPETKPLLEHLQLDAGFPDCRPRECTGIVSCWDGAEVVEHDFLTSPYGCAWHVHRRRFDRWLLGQALAAGAVCLDRSRVQSLTPWSLTPSTDGGAFGELHGWRIEGTFRGVQQRLDCEYVVSATGRGRRLGELLGGARTPAVTRHALCALLPAGARAGDARLFVERLRERPDLSPGEGWASVAPFDDARVQLTVVGPPEWFEGQDWSASVRERLMDACLLSSLASRVTINTPWRTCVANLERLTPAAGPRWAAVGDAALALDPLAGQGLFWALDSASRAAALVLQTLGIDSSDGEAPESLAAAYHEQLTGVYDVLRRQHADWMQQTS